MIVCDLCEKPVPSTEKCHVITSQYAGEPDVVRDVCNKCDAIVNAEQKAILTPGRFAEPKPNVEAEAVKLLRDLADVVECRSDPVNTYAYDSAKAYLAKLKGPTP